jgi:hypothetical protein
MKSNTTASVSEANPPKKKALCHPKFTISAAVSIPPRAAPNVSPDDMLITLYEVPGENISFGQGEAQRAKAVVPA